MKLLAWKTRSHVPGIPDQEVFAVCCGPRVSSTSWIFNINTANLSAGQTYVYRIQLNDGSSINFRFGLK